MSTETTTKVTCDVCGETITLGHLKWFKVETDVTGKVRPETRSLPYPTSRLRDVCSIKCLVAILADEPDKLLKVRRNDYSRWNDKERND